MHDPRNHAAGAWRAGMAKADITVYEPGMQMFGWAMHFNTSLGVATPLHARALVVDDGSGAPAAFVVCDLGIISLALRARVVELLAADPATAAITGDRLMLSATHTHSGPSGFNSYLFYSLTGPGFSARVLDHIASGVVAAIREAAARLAPATLSLVHGELPLSVPIAFNRALKPYRRNPEHADTAGLTPETATRRTMTLLRVDTADGAPIGLVSWFATHATTVHADNTLIHADHKGLAAVDTERAFADRGAPGFVAIYAQEAAGDVSPNFRYHRKRKIRVGVSDDDNESCAFVADAQRRLAMELHAAAQPGDRLRPRIRGLLRYVDMNAAPVDPAFRTADAPDDATTAPAVMGIGLMEGTQEGPGPLLLLRPTLRRVYGALAATQRLVARTPSALTRRFPHGPKLVFLQAHKGIDGRAFGAFSVRRPILPGVVDPVVRIYRGFLRADAVGEDPWVPALLPLQVLQLGHLVLATIPAEPTTTAGQRCREAVLRAFAAHDHYNDHYNDHGRDHGDGVSAPSVVVQGYANDYASYVTTAEEYDLQYYEGSSTLYGRNTLGGMLTALTELATAVAADRPPALVDLPAPTLDPGQISRRTFPQPRPARLDR